MEDVSQLTKEKCTGCGCCVSTCPKNAITMEKNNEGFYYPKINESKCINCGMCIKRCPGINNPIKNNKEQIESIVYAYFTTNDKVWLNSTSGGAFYDICKIYNDRHDNLKIYGAVLGDDFCVYHEGVSFKDINKIQKSKYVQSSLLNCFRSIKENLENDFPIIFSGTPCQIAGLRNYLNKDYDKLLLIDIVCHGVSSTDVLKSCLSFEEKKLKHKICKYTFRFKKGKKFTPSRRYDVEYILDNNKNFINKNDIFMKLFLKGSCLRSCCGANCQFKAKNSYSDISLADLNNKSKILPNLYDKRNYSSIFVHTGKGERIIKNINNNGNTIKCNLEKVVKYNKVYSSNPECNTYRENFFDLYIKNNGNIFDNEEYKKYLVESKISILDFIPYSIKFLLNKIK